MSKETRFLQIYANLPLRVRDEIILVIERDDGREEEITWNVAKIEIENRSPKGKEILDKLINLGIVK